MTQDMLFRYRGHECNIAKLFGATHDRYWTAYGLCDAGAFIYYFIKICICEAYEALIELIDEYLDKE